MARQGNAKLVVDQGSQEITDRLIATQRKLNQGLCPGLREEQSNFDYIAFGENASF